MKQSMAVLTSQTTIDRFWIKVAIAGIDDCWLWQAFIKPNNGYGVFAIGKYKRYLAHRIAYILTHGNIPDTLKVLHSCDNPACCNPKHLFLGTQLNNMQDRNTKNRQAKGSTCGRAKLKETDITEIRMMYTILCMTHADIAQLYNVSASCIASICQNKTWRHVS